MIKSIIPFSNDPASKRWNARLPLLVTPLGVYCTTTDYARDSTVLLELGRVCANPYADPIVLAGAAYRNGQILEFRELLKTNRRVLRHFLYVIREIKVRWYMDAYAHALQIEAEISMQSALREVQRG